jgi:hypothetical protein
MEVPIWAACRRWCRPFFSCARRRDSRKLSVRRSRSVTAVARVPHEDFGVPDNTPGASVRVTVPFAPRYSIEALMTVSRREEPILRVEGFYILEIKQRIRRATRGGLHPFLTYGAAGYFRDVRASPFQVPSPGGGVIVQRGFSYREIDQPIAAVIGSGIQYVLNRRLAVRAEAQLVMLLWMPLAGRFDAGVSIPIGRSYGTH